MTTLTSFLKRCAVPSLAMAGAALALFTAPAAAQADDWPSKPLTLIVPFAAGGGGDTIARLYTGPLSQALKQTIIVDNKPGAGGNIGTSIASRSAPDGQTMVFGTNGTMATNHWLYKDAGYRPDDFTPVALMSMISLTLVVNSDSPISSVADLIAAARKQPDTLTCASAGNGTASHIACGLLQQLAGIQVTHVPYKGGASAITDVISGQVSFMIDVTPHLIPHIESGRIRPLAVSTSTRVAALPDLPTLAESGVPGYELSAWDGIFVPKGTPQARVDKLNTAIHSILRNPEFTRMMEQRGSIIMPISSEAFAAFVKKEYERLGDIVRKLNITLG